MERQIPGGDITAQHIGQTLRWEAPDGREGRGVLESVVHTSVAKYFRFSEGQHVACVLPRKTLFGRTKEWKSNPTFWTVRPRA